MRSSSPRTPIPDVPLLLASGDGDPACPRCGGRDTVAPDQVRYRTYSGPYCTGLPDYFYLDVRDEPPTEWEMRVLGLPYLKNGIGRCALDSLDGLPLLADEWSDDRLKPPLSSFE